MQITKLFTKLFLTLLLTMVWSGAYAQITPTKIPMSTQVHSYKTSDDMVLLTIRLDMEPEWYTYADDPGGMGKPTRLTGQTAGGAPVAAIYPEGIEKPDLFDASVMVNTFQDGTLLYALAPADTPVFPVTLTLELLLCHPTKCIPVRLPLSFGEPGMSTNQLPPAREQTWWPEFSALKKTAKMEKPETSRPAAEQTENGYIRWNFTPEYLQPGLEVGSLVSAILMGLLAGLILNVMPCVLPVVSLKLSALLGASSENEADRIAAFREHNLFFALGVLTFFLFLALVLGATGSAWGALFQKQWLVYGLAGVIFILSLSLFGLFHLPVIDLKFGRKSKNPKVQAFFTGNLTTLLATPCSGPFLGGVLSWALVQGPIVIATVFISIGIGMASPYFILIANPALSRFLPKAGAWIEYVEKGVAFFLMGTAFYLASIAMGGESLRIFAPLWATLLGVWLWIRTGKNTFTTRWSLRAASIGLLIGLIVWTTPLGIEKNPWEPFNPVELSQRIGKEALFVDFTADWCPTCKVIEATVLTPENVQRWKDKYGIAFIKVDMTEPDPEAEALLRALGSMSIPAAAFFVPGEESSSPMVLRDLFTESQLENMLESWKK